MLIGLKRNLLLRSGSIILISIIVYILVSLIFQNIHIFLMSLLHKVNFTSSGLRILSLFGINFATISSKMEIYLIVLFLNPYAIFFSYYLVKNYSKSSINIYTADFYLFATFCFIIIFVPFI